MRIYLAGPINACSDEEVNGWRTTVKARLLDTVDPADRDFRGVEHETFQTIVEGDKADIDECDALLAYCWQPSYGTAMEILYAWEHGLRVVIVVPNGKPSPWLLYHGEVFETLEEAIHTLES